MNREQRRASGERRLGGQRARGQRLSPPLTIEVKRQIVRQASAIVEQLRPEPIVGGRCLYWAYAMCVVAHQTIGRVLEINAGSAFWVRDPGSVDVSEWGYEFTGAPVPRGLPEMHVWCHDVASGELVDAASGEFPAVAATAGFDWPGPQPPDWFWGRPDQLPQYDAASRLGGLADELSRGGFDVRATVLGAKYHASEDATDLAYATIERVILPVMWERADIIRQAVAEAVARV